VKGGASRRRNRRRIREANPKDEEIISKYPAGERLASSATDILGPARQGPDDWFAPPAWLMAIIQEVVVNTPVLTPRKPPIQFDTSPEALEANTALIASYDYDFEALLAECQDTTIGYNSEFRPASQLRKILGDHPNFEFFEEVAGEGMAYKFTSDIP
jgi:hypothetical protein